MRYIITIWLAFLWGCGADNSNQTSNDPAFDTGTPPSEVDIQDPPDVGPLGRDQERLEEVSIAAYLVKPGDDYPECSDDRQSGQLIYVQNDKAFYYCDTALGWTYIDLSGRPGKDGKDGKDGRDGANGKDGTNGQNGTNGTNGSDGSDGADQPPKTIWTNPISGARYILVSMTYIHVTANNYPCPSGSVKPSINDLWGAYYHFEQDFIYDIGTASSGTYAGQAFVRIQQAGGNVLTRYSSQWSGTTPPAVVCKITE